MDEMRLHQRFREMVDDEERGPARLMAAVKDLPEVAAPDNMPDELKPTTPYKTKIAAGLRELLSDASPDVAWERITDLLLTSLPDESDDPTDRELRKRGGKLVDSVLACQKLPEPCLQRLEALEHYLTPEEKHGLTCGAFGRVGRAAFGGGAAQAVHAGRDRPA